MQGGKYVADRARRWSRAGWRLEMRHDLDTEQAMARMVEAGALVVLPGRGDNSPATVIECMLSGLPVLTVEDSGAQELVLGADRAACVLPDLGRQLIRHERPVTGFSAGDVRQLASGIATRLLHGAAICRPSLPPLATVGAWYSMFAGLAKTGGSARQANAGSSVQMSSAAVIVRSTGSDLTRLTASLRSAAVACGRATSYLRQCTVVPVVLEASSGSAGGTGLDSVAACVQLVQGFLQQGKQSNNVEILAARAVAGSLAVKQHLQDVGLHVRFVYLLDEDAVIHPYGLL